MTLVAYGKDLIGKMDVRFFPDLMEKLLYTPASGVAGLSGFGVVGLGKTAMRVTPTVQKLINGAAGKWAARTQEILDASYVKGRIERGATGAQQPNLDTRSSSSSSDTRSSATSDTRSSDVRNIVNERNVINERNVDNTTTSRVEQPSPAGPEPVGPVPTPAPSPAPEPAPELITPPTPTPSSGSSGWLWMLGAIGALGVGVAMSDKNKNKRSAPMRPSRR
jgi:hypothetical protein